MRFSNGYDDKTGVLKGNNVTEITCSILEAFNNPINTNNKSIFNLNNVKILPPVIPSKVVCIGLNYKDHAHELDMDLPDEPVIFIKPTSSITWHLNPIIYPHSSKQVDYEAELAVIISKEANHVKEEDADEYMGGYTILNDVTARDLQRKDVQWTRGKSFNTFCPIGPCIETKLDPHNQKISLRLNGEIKQQSNTKNMIFKVQELIEFISDIMTLNPGDIISTGTPPGVGPMNVGDVVEIEIEEIGVLKNIIRQ